MKTERQVTAMLKKMRKFEKKEGAVTEELQGEMQALEYVLGRRDDLF